MSDDTFVFNDKGFKALIKAFKGQIPSVKVGVLGDKGIRSEGNSNAEILRKHEFGIGVPVRSVLRVPIIDNLQSYLNNSKAFDPEVLKKVVADKSISGWIAKIGIVAENIVQDAFDTGGFGKWPKHGEGYENNTGMVLVDTQQLRNSIASEVTEVSQ